MYDLLVEALRGLPAHPPPRPYSPAGPVGFFLWGPGWASGMASGRRPSFQGGGVFWGIGKSLSGPEGRSAASRRRTWTAEGQRVSSVARVNGDVSPRGPAAARCSCDHRPLAGMFSQPTPSPSISESPPTLGLRQGPCRHVQSHHTFLLEWPSLGLDCACMNNDHGHPHFTDSSLVRDQAGLSPTLSGSGHSVVREYLWQDGWMRGGRDG